MTEDATRPAAIPQLVILGGGTAGWLTAAYLSRVYEKTGMTITLVDAADIPPIGVGEATIPSIVNMIRILGRTEAEFLKRTDATFKQAIRFDNWRGTGDSFHHPFEAISLADGFGIAQHWLGFHKAGKSDLPYANFCGLQSRLCEAGVGPKQWNSVEFTAPLPYAYHLDALKFAAWLSEIAQERGVAHVRGRLARVERTADGDIAALVLDGGGRVPGTLFVDCTGFAAALIGDACGEKLVPLDGTLRCNRAVAARLPQPDGHKPRPYTTSTARDAGWIWDLDLAGRRGAGYVYAGDFLDDDAAANDLAAYLGVAPGALDLRHQEMPLGYRQKFWSGNCVAIGLAAGFVEPLESTGIHLIEAGIRLLIDNFPTGTPAADRALAGAYNQVMTETYARIVDFIALHYVASPRRDTAFWRACTDEATVPPRLAALLERWRARLPIETDFPGVNHLFGAQNYLYVLAGLAPERLNDNAAWALDRDSGLKMRKFVFDTQKSALASSPPQSDFLQKVTSSV